ncbi:hypothetical protein C5S31_04540 [ANME-1 cluster archaeon GoMg2]|nr:hypothetical protein [ANME-1 cluster archaeon GoMg2]
MFKQSETSGAKHAMPRMWSEKKEGDKLSPACGTHKTYNEEVAEDE